MAVIEVSVAGGYSNENGAYVGGVQPTNADDLLIPAGAGAFKTPTGATLACRSLEVAAGWTHEYTQEGTGTLAIGGATSKADKVALRMNQKANTITLSFVGSSGNTEKVFLTMSTLVTATPTFAGTAGTTYVLEETLFTPGTVTHSSGGLTVNATQEWAAFTSSVTTTRTLNIENQLIKLTGTGTVWTTSVKTGLTFKATGSTISITDATATGKTIAPGVEQTFYNLKLPGGASNPHIKITQSLFLNNLEFTEGQKVLLEPTKSIIIKLNRVTGAIGTAGNKITIESATAGTAFTLEARILPTDFIFNFCTFKDVTGSGIGCNFYAGASSTLVSGNTNLKLENAPAHEHTLSASQGQEATRTIKPTRVLAASQGQSITRTATPIRVLAASQAQSISGPRRAITHTLETTGVSSATISAPKTVAVTLAASQGQSASVARTIGHALAASQGQSAVVVRTPKRTLSVSQGQAATLGAALARLLTLTATQTATVTLMRTSRVTLAASQGQSASVRAALARSLAADQPQAASLRVALGKTLATSQGSSATVGATRVLHVTLSASQGSSAEVLHGHTLGVTLSASQASSATLGAAPGRRLAATQGQSASLARAISKSLSGSTSSGATVVRSLGRHLAATATPSASVSLTKTHRLSASQGSSAALRVALARTLGTTATATATVAGAQPVVAPITGTASTGPATISLTTVEQNDSSSVEPVLLAEGSVS